MTKKWQSVPLSEALVERQEIPSASDLESGAIRIVSKIGFNEGRIELRVGGNTKTNMILIRPGDLVLSGINALKGAIAIYDSSSTDPIAATIHYSAYSVKTDRADIKYLWWFFRSQVFRDVVLEYVSGGIKSELKPKRLLPIPIPIPPLPEQQRIVARIEAIARRVEEARGLRARAKIETSAILHSAQNQLIGSEPKSNWVPLQYYVAEIRNGKSPDCEKRPAKINEWGVLKVGAVSFGVYDEKQNKALPPAIEPNPKYEVKVGDFLMIRANTKELVGACAIVEETRPKLLISDKTFRFLFREDNVIDQRYLNHVLKSPVLRIQIEQQATGTSSTMKNISKEKVISLQVPCIPLDEQRRIVSYLDGLQAKVGELKRLQAQTQEELDALMPSVLAKAFKGGIIGENHAA
jgi:type I restriction enzyme S subunit